MTPCILIPCYNHAGPLAAVLARLAEYGLPCLLIDDGSEPVAAAELDALAARYPWVTLLRHLHNQGKGGAVMTGLRRAHALGFSHALQVDADGQHDLADIPALLAEADKHPAALVSGRPLYDDSVPKGRLYGRYITHVWVWIETLSFAIKDSMCGFRVYPLAATCALLDRVALGRRMDFDTEVMVRLYWAGVAVRFVPTRVIYPADGSSHFQLWRDNRDISWMHTRLVCRLLWDQLLRLCRVPRRLGARAAQLWRERRTHWSRTPERGSLLGMQIMLASYRLLGRRGFSLLLYPVIGYFWLTGRAQRQASQAYLARLESFADANGVALPLSRDRAFVTSCALARRRSTSWPAGAVTSPSKRWSWWERSTTRRPSTAVRECCCWAPISAIWSCAAPWAAASRGCASMRWCSPVTQPASTPCSSRSTRIRTSISSRCRSWGRYRHPAQGEAGAGGVGGDRRRSHLGDPGEAGDLGRLSGRTGALSARALRAQQRAGLPGLPDVRPQGAGALAGAFRALCRWPAPAAARASQILASRVQAYADRLQHHCLQAPLDWFNFFDFWQLTDEQE